MLLCFYGLGTNIGPEARQRRRSWRKPTGFVYTRRRFITRDDLRAATTSVAMPFSRFASRAREKAPRPALGLEEVRRLDQNLMTEWHARYRGPRHHDLLACRTQGGLHLLALKNCSFPKWRRCTAAPALHGNVGERQYVDTMGKAKSRSPFVRCWVSTPATAEGIHRQKLYDRRAKRTTPT